MKINILGADWEIERREKDEDENLKEIDGYTDFTTRKIVVAIVKREPGSVDDVERYIRKVTRHEIVHAFLFESGLHVNSLHFEDAWSVNEEMIDWFAFQGEKIYNAWQEAGAV